MEPRRRTTYWGSSVNSDENVPLLHPVTPERTVPGNRRPNYRKASEYYGPLSPGHAEGVPIDGRDGRDGHRDNEHTISAKYESQDYETCENNLFLEEERTKLLFDLKKHSLTRWIIMALVGISTAVVAACIDMGVEYFSLKKYSLLKHYVDRCMKENCLLIPYAVWLTINVVLVFFAAILASVIEPVAAGSGIPQVKCYLNGVKVPRIVRFRTLFAKAIGVTLSVVGGLAVGKEGPMIHSGAVIAAGISQGRSTSLGKDFKIFQNFRSDREKRDFVSGGAAAGVSAAFGAPVGGVLFSLEEGASFWNQDLTWRIFFCSMVSTFTLNFILSTYHGHPAELDYAGLLNFGKLEVFVNQLPVGTLLGNNIPYEFWELVLFALLGAVGGLSGAFFNYINYKLTLFRIRHVYNKWSKVLEAIIVAIMSATAGFITIYALHDCKPLGKDPTKYPIQFYCGDGEYNAVAALWFQTPESSVKSLFHDPAGSHQPLSLAVFFVIYFMLSCWTYGLGVPSGLFIPSLLTGAAWGRLVGIMVGSFQTLPVNPGKYALIGAAAQLGGVVRMTLSLTVILIEATGNISFGLPLMIVLVSAKWVGDYFNEGIYDMHIHLAKVPLLSWEPPPFAYNIYASTVMGHPVITLRTVEKVGRIIAVLKNEPHNGFPIVDEYVNAEGNRTSDHYRGLILRSQLITLLKEKAFNEDESTYKQVTLEDFRKNYPVTPTLEEACELLTPEERSHSIDLQPYMNPSPYTVLAWTSLPRIFLLFRGLGLRHLVVVTDTNEVIGIVTRKDLARYKYNDHNKSSDQLTCEELEVSSG